MKDSDNIIIKLTFEFALAIIEYCEVLEKDRRFVISNQLLKSGTSIGANVREAQNAKVKMILFINLKLQLKKLKKLFIGWNYVQ